MTIRTILVGASGGSASDGATELACRLAVRFGAHLEGYHVKVDPNEIVMAAAGSGVGMPVDTGWMDQLAEDADALAAKTRAGFLAAAAGHGLKDAAAEPAAAPGAGWRERVGPAGELIPARVRFFDLAVLGRSDRVIDESGSDVIENTLLYSGRPVLLAPSSAPTVFGETIAIGWDGSPHSVHAIAVAMPLLRGTKRVSVLTVGDKPEADAASLIVYLRAHGIPAASENLPAIAGVGAGEQLLSSARDDGADLLVMGAFGHGPWREMLFGGATRTIVGTSLLPVMMCH
jgi:nucleotide-binding universal stress UspA family protein